MARQGDRTDASVSMDQLAREEVCLRPSVKASIITLLLMSASAAAMGGLHRIELRLVRGRSC